MGADNWAVCPRCADRQAAKLAAEQRRVSALYGSVPAEEYLSAVAAHYEATQVSIKETFREDYEIYGAESGTVTFSYGGSCAQCGLSVTYNHDEPFYNREELYSNMAIYGPCQQCGKAREARTERDGRDHVDTLWCPACKTAG